MALLAVGVLGQHLSGGIGRIRRQSANLPARMLRASTVLDVRDSGDALKHLRTIGNDASRCWKCLEYLRPVLFMAWLPLRTQKPGNMRERLECRNRWAMSMKLAPMTGKPSPCTLEASSWTKLTALQAAESVHSPNQPQPKLALKRPI